MQNLTRKKKTKKQHLYSASVFCIRRYSRSGADTVAIVFFLCRVAAKQNEASESGDSVRTLHRTKEALGNAPPLFEIDQFFVSAIRDKFCASVFCLMAQ